MTLIEFYTRILGALSFGLLIGMERQWYSHPAGLRTNTLVCLGAALYVSVCPLLIHGSNIDPTRTSAQVITGIGFLGAGVILRDGLTIHGLTTAATLWCSASIGVLAGFGLLTEAALGTATILFVTIALRPLDKLLAHTKRQVDQDLTYSLKITCQTKVTINIRAKIIEAIATHSQLILHGLTTSSADHIEQKNIFATVLTTSNHAKEIEDLVDKLSTINGVVQAGWESSPRQS